MFNKISIIGNKIVLIKYIVEWWEISSEFDETTEEEICKRLLHTEWIQDEASKDIFVENLANQGIEYSVVAVEIPSEYMQFDGMEWTLGRDAALEMINNAPSYELEKLQQWFAWYDTQTIQYQRAVRCGNDFDKDIEKLDREAETNAVRINELKELLKGGSEEIL